MGTFSVEIGTQSIRSYKRLSYELWYALAEFVDNSTQSYFNNREALENAFSEERLGLEVRITYDKEGQLLRVSDNAMGMSLEELRSALRIAFPPSVTSGRSEFGMGLKTAACWLGDMWKIRTKKLGCSTEYEVTFDVERVADGNVDVPVVERQVPANDHYTIVEVWQLHQKLAGRTQGKAKEYLCSMYRADTRDGTLALYWGDELLTYDGRLDLLKGRDGSEYRKDFTFSMKDGRVVRGWGGVLNAGGRLKAGFAILRRGRVIQGQPSSWRPASLFGSEQGSNDLVNQRLIGEIHLDNFYASHTKSQILWQGEELEDVEKALESEFADFRRIALDRRVRGERGPSPQAIAVALDAVADALATPEFADMVQLRDVPTPELVQQALAPLRDNMARELPDRVVVVGDAEVKVFIDTSASPNDPYYLGDFTGSSISVSVNSEHPFWKDHLPDAASVLVHMCNCIFDALAEWKCLKMTGQIHPDTVKSVKDGFMRQKVRDA